MTEENKPAIDFKANYVDFLHHRPTALVPNVFVGNKIMGLGAINGPAIEKGNQFGDGLDGFGNKWEYPSSGAGAAVPDCTVIPLDDICNWREKVRIPDPSKYDWKADYEMECKMIGEPNRDYIIDAYHPDTITYYDDIATEKDLFMSPETFRTLIKPHHKRFAQACLDRGIIPIYHCCGHAEALVEDYIDCGWYAWTSVQVSNDIESLIENYGDRFGFIGGYDTNGAPGREDATPEQVSAEVVRCIDTYGKYHRGYCFFGFRYVNTLDPAILGGRHGAHSHKGNRICP